jgi:hypothetical protein
VTCLDEDEQAMQALKEHIPLSHTHTHTHEQAMQALKEQIDRTNAEHQAIHYYLRPNTLVP